MKSFRFLVALLSPMLLLLGCTKEKSFEVGNDTTSQWEFTEGSNHFHGKVDTAYKSQVAPGIMALLLEGTSDDGKGVLTLGVVGLNTSAPGVYKSPSVLFDYSKQNGTIYQNDVTAAGDFTIEVTKIDSVSVSGTFTGKAKDSSGTLKTITSGKFSARFGNGGTVGGNAQLTFWSKTGCSGSGPIKVSLSDGQTGNITSFTATEPGACGASGTASFTVPAGTYGWQAVCNSDTARGVIVISAGQCVKHEVALTSGPAAQYSLVTSGSACASFTVHGTFYATKAVFPDTNYVTVQVNVTTPGSYTIGTNTVNGYSFGASGNFTSTGVQTVTLKGLGTPLATGTNNFTVTAGSSTCSFPVTVVQLPAGLSTNTWSFTEGTKNFSGTWDGPALFGDDPFAPGNKALYLYGGVPGTDTAFEVYIQLPGSATQPIPGSYVSNPDITSSNTTDMYLYNLTTNQDYYYIKTTITTPPPPDVKMTFVITSYDAANKIVKGTFSGKAWNSSGQIVNITNGKFESDVQF